MEAICPQHLGTKLAYLTNNSVELFISARHAKGKINNK